MRKALAGALIRLAHCIYRPRVTVDRSINFHIDPLTPEDMKQWRERQAKLVRLRGCDGSLWDIRGVGGGGGTYLPRPDDGSSPVSL